MVSANYTIYKKKFSVSTLINFLGCFNGNEDVCIGERYGYHLLSDNGYNYITGEYYFHYIVYIV